MNLGPLRDNSYPQVRIHKAYQTSLEVKASCAWAYLSFTWSKCIGGMAI
jgi:hypothetical protein